MQPPSQYDETSAARDGENSKTAWHRPNVARIDIKRTLLGSGSATDGPSQTT